MARRRPKILILEDDKEISFGLHRVLYEGNDRFDVLLAFTAETARDIMRDLGVDVLITDADIPSAVDLVCWAAIEFPETLYILKTRNDVDALEERISGLGCLRLVRKPSDPQEILKIVHEALDCIHRLSGCFSALSAADLIQMLCLAKRTSALRISSHGISGSVCIADGKLLYASWGSLEGQEALCEIIDAEDGIFRTAPLPSEVVENIHTDWQYAIMNAVRTLDERSHTSLHHSGSFPAIHIDEPLFKKMPSPNERVPSEGINGSDYIEHRKTPRVASSLVDKGFAALRAGNLDEARQCWLAAKQLDPDNRALDLNLKKLETRTPR